MNTFVQRGVDSLAPSRVLELAGETTLAASNRLAVTDVADGLRLWRLAWALGWLDIRLRYRGSILGPFWLTISTTILVAALGVLYSTLFHIDIHQYLPFLALSQVLWFFIAAIVGDACTSFTQAEGVIRAVRLPLFLHAIRTVIRNVLVLAHNIVVIVAVDIIFEIWPGLYGLMALPGIAVWLIDALAVCLLLGAFCARFRDVAPIVASIMQIAFFITPVMWQPEQLGERAWILPFSPFYALLEIVRAPLLGQLPTPAAWISAMLYSVVLCVVSWGLFVRARGRLAFWL